MVNGKNILTPTKYLNNIFYNFQKKFSGVTFFTERRGHI